MRQTLEITEVERELILLGLEHLERRHREVAASLVRRLVALRPADYWNRPLDV